MCMCFESEFWGDEGRSSEEETVPKSFCAALCISHDGGGGPSMWPARVTLLMLLAKSREESFPSPVP